MEEEKKRSISGLGAIGCLGLIFCLIAAIVVGGVPGAFIDIPSAMIVLAPTFFLLLMVYGKDYLHFIPYSIVALFSKNVEPDPLFAKIAETGSRYVIASGSIGTSIGIITMLQCLDDPAKIGSGMAVALLSLFYSLIISEFYFISVYNTFSSVSKEGEASGNRKITRLHFFIPALLILLILMCFFMLLIELPSDESGDGRYLRDEIIVSGLEVSMPPVVANVAKTQGKRSITVIPVFELSSPKLYKYFYHKSDEYPEGMFNKIKARIIDIISQKSLEYLLNRKSKMELTIEIKAEVNVMLERKRAFGMVKNVYFSEYLIQ